MSAPQTEMNQKEAEANASVPPSYYSVPMSAPGVPVTSTLIPQQDQGSTLWYVLSIVTSVLCCCMPCVICSVIGIVHAMIAKHEGERGNFHAHKNRLCQAKCWTGWAMGLIALFIVVIIILLSLGAKEAGMMAHKYGGEGGEGYRPRH